MYNVAGIGVADLVGLVARVAQRTVPSRELVASPEMDNKLKSSIRSHLALSLVIDFWAGAVCLQLSFFNSVRLWNSRNPVLSFSDCSSLPWLGAVRWPSCHTALPCLALCRGWWPSSQTRAAQFHPCHPWENAQPCGCRFTSKIPSVDATLQAESCFCSSALVFGGVLWLWLWSAVCQQMLYFCWGAAPWLWFFCSQAMPTGLQHALAVRKCERAGQLCLIYSHCYSIRLKYKLTFLSLKWGISSGHLFVHSLFLEIFCLLLL